MANRSRRTFLKRAAIGAAAVGVAPAVGAAGANEKIVVGLIGCGGRGVSDARDILKVPNVELTYVCDPIATRLAKAARQFDIPSTHIVSDMRTVLDDTSVDAVIVATPDHWHSPASILACDADKHVYVEKPCSHNIREGRLLVEAARRKKRIVQHGTQIRSTRMMIEAIAMLREGAIGEVLIAKVWNIQRRGSIGHAEPTQVPPGMDYDMWVGPAPMVPYQTNRTPEGWHWWYHFGTGDMGNDGIHDIEYARWGLGVTTHPTTVSALGGKYFFDDDQEFPDTQQVAFEYPGDGTPGQRRMLIYEQRLWSTNYPFNVDSGVEYYGTEGKMFLSRRGKVQLLGERNRHVDVDIEPEPQNTLSHLTDFIDSIRSGRRPNADIHLGHLTATLCHLGNIATRLGRQLKFDPKSEKILGDAEANRLVSRDYRKGHWATPDGA